VTVQNLLARLIAALEAAEIPYMLTGSYASSIHSIPRATRDLDIIIFPNRDQLTRFIDSLPPAEYHADLEDALDSLRRRTQFNVIDYATGWKVDFIIPPLSEFNLEEFDRRKWVEFEGMQLSVVSAEDIVVAKLLWAKAGESELQLDDAAAVVRLQRDRLDIGYIERWVRRLEVHEQWAAVRRRVAS
jgi:hypothetical protein